MCLCVTELGINLSGLPGINRVCVYENSDDEQSVRRTIFLKMYLGCPRKLIKCVTDFGKGFISLIRPRKSEYFNNRVIGYIQIHYLELCNILINKVT